MKRIAFSVALCVAFCVACASAELEMPGKLGLVPAWRSETFAGCVLASPLEHDGRVIVATGDGRIAALEPTSGETAWSVPLPREAGRLPHVIATPVIVGDRLVLTWQVVADPSPDPAAAPRFAHHAAVVDLARGELDPAFPVLTLAATQPSVDGSGEVVFSPNNALSRARLVHARDADHELGFVYLSFGNARDIQPWHGWIFELDLDAWRSGGTAVSATLLTSPSNDCGTPGTSGSTDMICGAGVWSPAGPLLVEHDDAPFELIVPTGNGALDLAARSYAHTLLRVRGPGLSFEPRCDEAACASFDVLAPDAACLTSCEDLFVPRLGASDPPFDAPGCEGLSFFECYAVLDWDLGANTPARVELASGPVLVLPAKDGGAYLLDAEHLGTLHDRATLVAACGAGGVSCDANWAGMMVTQPVIAAGPMAIIATFMPDAVHPAGLVALRIVEGIVEGDEGPRFERAWEYPPFEDPDARARFRRHPSGVRLVEIDGVEHVVVIEQGRFGAMRGVVHVVRASDGALAARAELDGPGQRYAVPLVLGDRLFVPSCDQGNAGPGRIEAIDVVRR